MAAKNESGKKIASVIFGVRSIALFENGFVSISVMGSLGNRVGGFLKAIEKVGNTKDKEEQKQFFADAKSELKNPSSGQPEKLISIDLDTQNVTKKTGVGRGVAAALTFGASLNAPSNRGDIYLTIVTEKDTYSLHQTFPEESEIRKLKKFVATANSLI